MLDDSAVILIREMLILMLKISAPILAAGMLVGLIISLIQAVTSIQDQTLTFVPKIAVMVIVAAVLIPWILGRIVAYAAEMFILLP